MVDSSGGVFSLSLVFDASWIWGDEQGVFGMFWGVEGEELWLMFKLESIGEDEVEKGKRESLWKRW